MEMDQFFCTAQKVYNALSDEVSKKIYTGMVMFNLTRDASFVSYGIKDRLAFEGADILSVCRLHEKQPIALIGAGWFGAYTMTMYPEIRWCCCVDNNKTGTLPSGIEILSVEELRQRYPDAFIVIAVRKYSADIMAQLRQAGVEANNIYPWVDVHDNYWNRDHLRFFAARQYFDLPALKHEENEVFVDAGGFDGETSRNFMKWANNQYKHIYVFEANPNLYERCCNNLLRGDKCTVFSKGLWDEPGKLSFRESPHDQEFNINLLEHNCFDKENEDLKDWVERTIDVVRMDDVLPDERVTFIKMDIEGSELNALRGAENIIRKYRPKLAISVYHRRDDLWMIPAFLLEVHPDYKLYLRSYTFGFSETVLYAI